MPVGIVLEMVQIIYGSLKVTHGNHEPRHRTMERGDF
jgi:hypothetical protein